jgi:hypothetical protein
MEPPALPDWVTTSEITAAVRRMPGKADVSVADWSGVRLTDGFGEGLGVWRVSGHATAGNALRTWSMVLKGWSAPPADAPSSAFNWPLRELQLYRSGLLAALPGAIRAPSCYGVVERPDGSSWLWLEEIITGAREGSWSLGQYAEVSRHLGMVNAACLLECERFDGPWVSRDWLRGWVEAAAPFVAQLAEVAAHPVVRRTHSPAVIAAYTHLWDERRALLDQLDRQPRAFSHLDAFRRNVFLRPSADGMGDDDIVLIDWGFAGAAAIGEEIAPLVGASLYFVEVPIEDAIPLQDAVLAGYLEGLKAGGWRGDPDAVRRAYAIASTLRYGVGVLRVTLPILLDEARWPAVEQAMRQPIDVVIETVAGVNAWLMALGAEILPRP